MNKQRRIPASESGKERALPDRAGADGHLRDVALTPIRRLVLRLLQQHPQGVKAYDLLDLIRPLKPNAAPPTVYRALNFLVTQGLAHKISCMNLFIACHQNGRLRDEAGLFLVCPHCHSVTEFYDDTASRALHQALYAAGYRLDRSVMEIGAVCPSCNAQHRPRQQRRESTPRR